MCVVSYVQDYFSHRPQIVWTNPAWDEFKKLIDQAGKVDALTDQPDCEDPAKAAWMKGIEDRLAKLEGKPAE